MPMRRRKGGKGKRQVKSKDPNAFTEVDKAFYELQIVDLNRKLARLRSLTQDQDTKTTELELALQKLDEDRNDIILYLKRTLQEKIDELNELQQRLTSLQETRNEENEDHKQQVYEMEQEYKNMQEELSSEIKLLNGKLNALEEFRLQRDELMKKYEEQENAMEEQELRHKREIYAIERKFIIGKDKLKKEMEARLLKLSTDFQNVTDLRVAATTHRVIRENIAINNELNTMLVSQKQLENENETLKKRDNILRWEADLHDSEKKRAIYKVKTQVDVINTLSTEHAKFKEQLERYKNLEALYNQGQKELRDVHKSLASLEYKFRLLEQNLHQSRCDRAKIQIELETAIEEGYFYKSTVTEASFYIKRALGVDATICRYEDEQDEDEFFLDKDELIRRLYTLLTDDKGCALRKESRDTIKSCSEIYAKGDLGFVPKKVALRSKVAVKKNVELQMGPSFDDFLAQQESIVSEVIEEIEEASIEEEVQLVEEEESQVFFSASHSEQSLSSSASGRVDDEATEVQDVVQSVAEEEETEGGQQEGEGQEGEPGEGNASGEGGEEDTTINY